MKIIFLLFLIQVSNLASAWELQDLDGKIYLNDSNLKVHENIIAAPKEYKRELVTKELASDLTLITYLMSIGGTKEVSLVYNCSLYSKKLKKIIFKDNLCKTIIKKSTPEVEEAIITFNNHEVTYQYEDLVEKYPR